MGFIGTLVAWRGSVDDGPEDGVADDHPLEDYESRGGSSDRGFVSGLDLDGVLSDGGSRIGHTGNRGGRPDTHLSVLSPATA